MISKGWHSNTQTEGSIYIYLDIYIYTWFAKNVTSGWFGKFFGLSSAWPKAPGAREGGSGGQWLGAFFQVKKKHKIETLELDF